MLDQKSAEEILQILYTAKDGCDKNLKQQLTKCYYQSDVIQQQFGLREDWVSAFLLEIYLEKIHASYINQNIDVIYVSDNIFNLLGLKIYFYLSQA